MKIEQLYQLIKIVENGSINEAAKELFIARSSLSSAMKNLEVELGNQIFERHSKGISLTEFGRDVYAQANEITNRIEFLINTQRKRSNKVLRIGSMYCSMANDAVAELLINHYGEELNLTIEETGCADVLGLVKDGFCEIGVLSLFQGTKHILLSQIEEYDLEWHGLVDRKIGAIVGPKNPLYELDMDEINLDVLKEYPHLENYATPTELPFEYIFGATGQYHGEYRISDLGLALRIVQETDAVMIDSYDNEIYNNFYKNCDYRFIPIKDYPQCTTGWIKMKNRKLTPLAEEFIELFNERTKKAR